MFQFAAIYYKRPFMVPRLHFWKKNWVSLADAEFNAESIGINLKSQKWKSHIPFSDGLFSFLDQFS